MGRALVTVHDPDTTEESVQERLRGGPGHRKANVSLRELHALQACDVPQQERLGAVFLFRKPCAVMASCKSPGVARQISPPSRASSSRVVPT